MISFGIEGHSIKIPSSLEIKKLNCSFAPAILSKHMGSFCFGCFKVSGNG